MSKRDPGKMVASGVLALLLVVTLTGASLVGGCRSGGKTTFEPQARRVQPLPMPTPTNAVWVARFHYHFPDDIRTIMRNCAAAGCNTVLWQVRGEGTVLYPSKHEPWSAEYGYRDPGFDPLRIAVEEAHKNGLRIEAWVNTMPGWKGPKEPPVKNQLWYQHPDWFLRDARGQRQPLGKFYVILNPCLPEVRRHITGVVDEIVSNYDVDGVHLDYVRYAWETTPNARNLYPRDPATLAIYRNQTGKHPDDDAKAWSTWRANQLTRLVGEIKQRVEQRRPGATLTAAVWSSPHVGYRDYFQNPIAWLRTGMVDAVMPMAYTESADKFAGYIDIYHNLAPNHRVVPGIGAHKHETPEQLGRQMQLCRQWGGDFAIFSYDSIHATAGDRNKNGSTNIPTSKQRLRQMRTGVIRQFTTR